MKRILLILTLCLAVLTVTVLIAASFQFTIGVIPAPQQLAKRIADQVIPKGLEDSAPARTSPHLQK